jgi:hypothetical protein
MQRMVSSRGLRTLEAEEIMDLIKTEFAGIPAGELILFTLCETPHQRSHLEIELAQRLMIAQDMLEEHGSDT